MSSGLQPWVTSAGLVMGAYLCGAIPFGLLVGWARGVDIRTRGSGNIGATNAGRVLGRPFGILVFVLDVLKGLLPVVLSGYLLWRPDWGWGGDEHGATMYLSWVMVAAGCIVGHTCPVYLGFKGGKGVATSLGVLLGLYPYFTAAGLIAFGLWCVATLATRYVSVGSVAAAVSFPIIFAVLAYERRGVWGPFDELWPLHAFGVAITALVVYRHRSNLRRLAAGEEPRIGISPERRI